MSSPQHIFYKLTIMRYIDALCTEYNQFIRYIYIKTLRGQIVNGSIKRQIYSLEFIFLPLHKNFVRYSNPSRLFLS